MKWLASPILIAIAALAATAAERLPGRTAPEAGSVTSIYWSDGDSGRIDGMKFRLSNVDAPETGGVGSIGGARCEPERVLGFDAKAFIVETTRNADIRVSHRYGTDRYGREVVDIEVGGQSLADIGLAAGHYRPWPHDGQRALSRKPDWCGAHQIASLN